MVDFLVAHFQEIMFYLLAALCVAGGVGVITLRNPVHSAVSLLGTFLVVAALFVLRHAEFLAAVQIMVYAGGIMVLFLFVIMLVNIRRLQPEQVFLSRHAPIAVAAGVLLGAVIAFGALWGAFPADKTSDQAVVTTAGEAAVNPLQEVDGEERGNTEAVGWELYRTYLVPFEVVSIVLLVAMIGAIIYGRKGAALATTEGRAEQ
jgi:NADH-quinone oxidoreductase subunit J